MLTFIALSMVLTLSFATPWTDDDPTISWDGRSGWRIFDKTENYHAATCKDVHNQDGPCKRIVGADTDTPTTYYGPFENGRLRIQRRIECSTQATVTVTFKEAVCDGDTGTSRVWVDNNKGGTQTTTTIVGTLNPSELADVDSSCTTYSVDQNVWAMEQIVRAYTPFDVIIQMYIPGTGSVAYLFDVEIACTENTDTLATPAPGMSTHTQHQEYCIAGLPAYNGVSRDGEYELALRDNSENTVSHNSNCVFAKDNHVGSVFLYEEILVPGPGRRWVFGDSGYAVADEFAYCAPTATTSTQNQLEIPTACGCVGTDECTAIYDIAGASIDGVRIVDYECEGDHVVILSDTPPGGIMTPFGRINMEDEIAMMGLLTSLCVASFMLGMCTLYVCCMACAQKKSKPYQKVHPKDVDILDEEDVLDHVLKS